VKWLASREGKTDGCHCRSRKLSLGLRETNAIDEDGTASDAAALCGSLGQSDDEQAEVFDGVKEADTPDGDRHDPAEGSAACG
jgi:hypothetical protein